MLYKRRIRKYFLKLKYWRQKLYILDNHSGNNSGVEYNDYPTKYIYT